MVANPAIELIRNLNALGDSYKEIAAQTGLSKTTIGRIVRGYRSTKKGRVAYSPSLETTAKIVKNVSDIESESNFYAEAIKYDRIRRAKSRQKTGQYIAGKGRIDERDCFKINRKVLYRNKEKMYSYIENLILSNLKTWKKRGDTLFYIRAFGHLSMQGERRELSIPTEYCNGNLKNAINTAYETFIASFEWFIDRDYAEMWIVTDITVCGAHFTLHSFDNTKPKKLTKKKTGRKLRRAQIKEGLLIK